MKEIAEIIEAYDHALAKGKRMALATVVQVEGSAYRRPGARMLITEDGDLIGAISGGCLEGDALQKALSVIVQNKNRLVTYDTSDEDDARLGLGLGCEGIIQVLLETIIPGNDANPIELLRQAMNSRQHTVVITLYNLCDRQLNQYGTKTLVQHNADLNQLLSLYNQEIVNAITNALAEERSSQVQLTMNGQEMDALIQYLPPAQKLVIVGAGNDVIPLVNMAGLLGWNVIVLDGRPAYASKDRFGASCQVIVSKPAELLQNVTIDRKTAVVLMTHNYEYDKAVLSQLLQSETGYIGVLGPLKKLQRMLTELNEDSEQVRERHPNLYGPVGLEIGAETAEEIALSIVAEIKAVFSNKIPVFLRDKKGQIHENSKSRKEESFTNE